MAGPVTDPALLAALNAPDPAPAGRVTDPALIAALEGRETAPPVAAGKGILGTIDDYVRAAANGMTFGLADRFAAGMGSATGIGGKSGGYSGNLQAEQGKTDQFATDHPIGSIAANVAGGAVVPIGAIGAAAKGASLGAKTLYGMGAGAGLGGLQGALSSRDLTDLPTVAADAGKGAVLGGTVGAVLPGAGKVLGSGYNAVADALTGRAAGLSRAATGHLTSAVGADGLPAVQARLAQLGPDATLADAGPALLGKMQGAVGNSDEARSIGFNMLKTRDLGTNARVYGDVNRALGPAGGDAQSLTDAIIARRSAVDDQNYGRALRNPAGVPEVDTSSLLADLGPRIGKSVGMEQRALSNLREMLMTEKPFPVMDPQTGRPMVSNGQVVTEMRRVPQTDPEILHKIKGEIDAVINYDAPGLGVPSGALKQQQGALKQMRGSLNGTLEDQVPGYAEANAASSALAKQAEAVQAGTQYLGSGKTTPSPDRFAAEFGQLSPEEKAALAQGSRANIERVLGTNPNDLVAIKRELQGSVEPGEPGAGWNTAKIATVHGPDAANELLDTVDRNMKFRDTYTKVAEGSQTDLRNAARKAMKPEPAIDIPLFGPSSTLTGMGVTAAKKAAVGIANALFQKDPTASYGEVARVLAAQGGARDAHLQAIADALARRQSNAAASPVVGDRAALVAAILGNAYAQSGPRRRQEQ